MDNNKKQIQVKILRIFRKIHRWTGVFLFVFYLSTGITGILLGWKKNSGGWILAATERGSTTDLSQWLPLDKLTTNAISYITDSLEISYDPAIDRIDVRPDKGSVKYTFKHHYIGLQLDGATGIILKKEYRRADLLEHIHDGSWIDRQWGLRSDIVKLIYTSIIGIGLIIFCITGFWLWYGPKSLRKNHT